MKLILALLPFDEDSREQVRRIKEEVLSQLEAAHNAQCMGTPTDQCLEPGQLQGAVFTLVYDWKAGNRFKDSASNGEMTPFEDASAKLRAAKAYFTEVHETVTKLLMQWVYVG